MTSRRTCRRVLPTCRTRGIAWRIALAAAVIPRNTPDTPAPPCDAGVCRRRDDLLRTAPPREPTADGLSEATHLLCDAAHFGRQVASCRGGQAVRSTRRGVPGEHDVFAICVLYGVVFYRGVASGAQRTFVARCSGPDHVGLVGVDSQIVLLSCKGSDH